MSPSGEGASHETERQRAAQPPREDLIDPEDIEIHPDEERSVAEGDDQGILPDSEARPESQGVDVLDADRFTEDHSERDRDGDDDDATPGVD